MATVEPMRPDVVSDQDLWLHPEAGADARMVVKDQFGRTLRGVRGIEFRSAMDAVNEMTVTFLPGTSGPMTNRKQVAGEEKT